MSQTHKPLSNGIACRAQHTRRSPTPRVRSWGRGGADRDDGTAAGSAAGCQQNPAQNTKFKVQRPTALARRRVACRVKSVNMYITHRAKYKCEDQASVRQGCNIEVCEACARQLDRLLPCFWARALLVRRDACGTLLVIAHTLPCRRVRALSDMHDPGWS